MIIKELIDQLKFFPQDTEVGMLCPDGYAAGIGSIEISNRGHFKEVLLVSEDIVEKRKLKK